MRKLGNYGFSKKVNDNRIVIKLGSEFMKKTQHCFLYLCIVFLLLSCIAWKKPPALGVIKPGEYILIPVANHKPVDFKNSHSYWRSLQNVELQIKKPKGFTDLPVLGLKAPFTGEILLGDKPQKFGVIVDIWGEEKRLYIDTDGDGSFADETWYPLLNEWEGLQIYWVESPEPINLKVSYNSTSNQTYDLKISAGGLLNRPGPFLKEKPYLRVEVLTWFLAKLIEDGHEKLVALVDQNNNGRFNDPEDQIYIDFNDDSNFSEDESLTLKDGITIKSNGQSFKTDWGPYPGKLVVGGNFNEKS